MSFLCPFKTKSINDSIFINIIGVFSGTLGKLLSEYQTIVNIVSGVIVILFGLSYLEIFRIPFFKGAPHNVIDNIELSRPNAIKIPTIIKTIPLIKLIIL